MMFYVMILLCVYSILLIVSFVSTRYLGASQLCIVHPQLSNFEQSHAFEHDNHGLLAKGTCQAAQAVS